MKGMNGTSELECTTTWKGVRYQRCLKTEYAPLSFPRMKVRRGFVLWLSSCQCAALVLSVGV
eukprot:scaffold7879_cov106-Alexandrium_tamarense.AAC.1